MIVDYVDFNVIEKRLVNLEYAMINDFIHDIRNVW